MSTNALAATDLLTQETLMHFVNELTLYKKVDHQWEDKFANDGAKIGDSLRIRKPRNFTVRTGTAVDLQNLEDDYTTLQLNRQIGVDFSFTSAEATLTLDRLSERYYQPAARRLANEVDQYLAQLYLDVPNFEGTPGTVPSSLSTYLAARTRQSNLGVPIGNRNFAITPAMEAAMITDLRGLFQSESKIKGQFETATMTKAIGYDWEMDQNLQTHVAGSPGGTPLSNGVSQTGSSIAVDGMTATTGTFKRGDVVTFAGTNAVNPLTGASTGQLRQFVITADVTANGSGQVTLVLSPAVVVAGPYKTCTAAIADNSALLLFGAVVATYGGLSTPQGLAFHKNAFTAAIVGLEKPNGVQQASYKSDPDAGVSMRFVCQYEARTDLFICRFDVLVGVLCQIPDFAVRIGS